MHCRRVTIHTDCVIPCHNDCHALTLYTYHISKTSSTVRTACLLFLEFVHIIYLLHLRPYGASSPSLAKALIASYMYFLVVRSTWLMALCLQNETISSV